MSLPPRPPPPRASSCSVVGLLLLALSLVGQGCGGPKPQEEPGDGSTDTSAGSTERASAVDTSSGTTGGTDDGTTTYGEESDTLCMPEQVPGCDPFSQDCPRGEKCAPAATDDCGTWSTTTCTPLPADPVQEGEPCTISGGIFDMTDDCDVGLVCWHHGDPWQNTCIPLCGGSVEEPTCPAWYLCEEVSYAVVDGIHVCSPTCDPLNDDCPPDYACAPWGSGYQCTPTTGAQPPGEACGPGLDCASGSRCIHEQNVPDCTDGHCCSSFCDLTAPDPDTVCLPGQTCMPWGGAPELVPPELQHVGVCAL